MVKPLSPAEVQAQARPDPARLEYLIERTNKALCEMATQGHSSWIAASKLGETRIERKAVVEAFVAAGWVVTYRDDQREGAAYEFKPKKQHA